MSKPVDDSLTICQITIEKRTLNLLWQAKILYNMSISEIINDTVRKQLSMPWVYDMDKERHAHRSDNRSTVYEPLSKVDEGGRKGM